MRLRWYVILSLFFHLLLTLALVDIELSGRDSFVPEVYEVDIVTETPSMSHPSPSHSAAASGSVREKPAARKVISEITKEKALPDIKPELAPSKIEPLEPIREEPEDDSSPNTGTPLRSAPPSPVSGQARGVGNPDETAYLKALWISQVRSLVERVWKAPPDIDTSLKATYRLKVSRSGELMEKTLLVSSGNSPYDRSVHLALNSIKRLPPPPSVMTTGQGVFEVTMTFTPPKGAQ